jgi:hypothetical protein
VPSYDADVKVVRDQLYKEVWAEPMTTVAKRYAVSSNYLARVPHCQQHHFARLDSIE